VPSFSSATPARLTALATTRLPRLVLLAVIFLYILLGLFGRDPWKTDDVVGLAAILTAARDGGSHHLFPHIGNMALASIGPMIHWVGVVFIKVFGPLFGDIAAARLATIFWFALCLGTLWYGTYLAGRRPEAQPLALPFGGEPKEAQYGQLLADISVLFLIATVGIVLRTHETSVAILLMAFQGLALLGTVRLLDKPVQALLILIVAICCTALTDSLTGAVATATACVLACISHPLRHRLPWALVASLLGFIPVWQWYLAIQSTNPEWAQNWWFYNGINLTFGRLTEHLNPFRDLPWFIWPTWPLALLAMWNWRKMILAPHIWIPTSFIVCQSIAIVLTPNTGELDYIALTVPCAMLAAFSVPTLRRAVVNALDWFALMYFSVTGVTVWLGWVTQKTGWPEGLANNIARQTVGYSGSVSIGAVAMALIVTAIWVATITWRIRYNPKAAWRGAMLCAVGLTSSWILLVLLWMPTVDYVRSYRAMSAQLTQVIHQAQQAAGRPLCIQSSGLSIGAQASLYVFDGLDITHDDQCPLILQQTTAEKIRQGIAGFDTNTTTLWTGSRGADRFDRYRLLLKTNP